MSKPRKQFLRIPHLELRPQGYVWRRRFPKELIGKGARVGPAVLGEENDTNRIIRVAIGNLNLQ